MSLDRDNIRCARAYQTSTSSHFSFFFRWKEICDRLAKRKIKKNIIMFWHCQRQQSSGKRLMVQAPRHKRQINVAVLTQNACVKYSWTKECNALNEHFVQNEYTKHRTYRNSSLEDKGKRKGNSYARCSCDRSNKQRTEVHKTNERSEKNEESHRAWWTT